MKKDLVGLTENRIFMYLLYGSIATVFYHAAFNLTSFGPEIGFFVVSLAFLKDTVDELLLRKGKKPGLYRYIEHNPFNIILVIFLAFLGYSGEFSVSGTVIRESTVIGMATLEFAVDLVQDLKVEKDRKLLR